MNVAKQRLGGALVWTLVIFTGFPDEIIGDFPPDPVT